MQATGMAEPRQALLAWGTSGALRGRSPGLARGRTWPRMWHKATVLPAGTQVGCSLAPVSSANIVAAVAPVPTDFADESAVVSLRAVATVLVLWSLGGMACQCGSLIRSMLT